MSSPQPIRPIQKLTVMIDASVYHHNPYAGEQLACLFNALQHHGTQCCLLQDRFGVTEATGRSHELMLSEDIAQQAAWMGGPNNPTLDHIRNYLRVTSDIATAAPIRYVQSAVADEVYQAQRELTRTHLFTPRLKTALSGLIEKQGIHSLVADTLDEYEHSVYTVCVKCAHTINAIHQRIKNEAGFKASLTPQDCTAFMLDKFPSEGEKVHWSQIDLTKIDPEHIPTMVVDAFNKTKTMHALLGKKGDPTELGRQLLERQMKMAESITVNHAVDIVEGTGAIKPASDNIVLVVTDDKKEFADVKELQKHYPSILCVNSRELAAITCELANGHNLEGFFPSSVVDSASTIRNGAADTWKFARDLSHIAVGQTSFVKRIVDNASLSPDDRNRLLSMGL